MSDVAGGTTLMATEEGFEVELPSGSLTRVQHEREVQFVREKAALYLEHNHFTNISDIMDVDRMITLELQVWRLGNFLNLGGTDWFNKPIDGAEARRALTSMSTEIRQTKKLLQIDKGAREAERGEASVAGYLAKVRDRAEEFGIHRDMQICKVLELGMQLIALATYHGNCTDEERRELHITLQDLYEWIRDVFSPQLLQLDEHFRTTNQRIWIQEM